MDYGKRSKHESYFNGMLKSVKTEYSVPIIIGTKSDVMTEIIKALDLIDSKETCNVTINIKADPKTYQFKLLTKTYTVEEM